MNTTQWIEPIFLMWLKNWTSFVATYSKHWPSFVKNSELNFFSYDSKNWTSFFKMTQRIEPLRKGAERIEPLFFFKELKFSQIWSKELDFLWWLTDLNVLCEIWLENLTQRIELCFFQYDSKIWIFSVWPKELNFFLNRTDRIEPFFLWIRRKELDPFFFENDAKYWTF